MLDPIVLTEDVEKFKRDFAYMLKPDWSIINYVEAGKPKDSAGGFGIVASGKTNNQHNCVLKFVRPFQHYGDSRTDLGTASFADFHRELEIMKYVRDNIQARHQQVPAKSLLQVYDGWVIGRYGTNDSLVQGVYAVEHLTGGDLATYIFNLPKDRYIKEENLRHLLHNVFLAIKVLHDHRIVHNDLKIENLVFRDMSFSQLVIVDFGLSYQLRWPDDTNQMSRPEFGKTVPNFSPEQRNQQILPSNDIYAMGYTLYQILFSSGFLISKGNRYISRYARELIEGMMWTPTERILVPHSAADSVHGPFSLSVPIIASVASLEAEQAFEAQSALMEHSISNHIPLSTSSASSNSPLQDPSMMRSMSAGCSPLVTPSASSARRDHRLTIDEVIESSWFSCKQEEIMYDPSSIQSHSSSERQAKEKEMFDSLDKIREDIIKTLADTLRTKLWVGREITSITIPDFVALLNNKSELSMFQSLAGTIDFNGDGNVDYEEITIFLHALGLFSTRQICQFLFKLCDRDNDNEISVADLVSLLGKDILHIEGKLQAETPATPKTPLSRSESNDGRHGSMRRSFSIGVNEVELRKLTYDEFLQLYDECILPNECNPPTLPLHQLFGLGVTRMFSSFDSAVIS